MLKIEEVKTKKQLKEFIKFGNDLYVDCPYQVFPFPFDEMAWYDPKKSPVYENVTMASFLALRDEKIVGRITVLVHHLYNEKNNSKKLGLLDLIS